MQHVVDDDRPHRVQLKISLAAGEGNSGILPDHLDADHHDRLALGWIDLARHDRGARFVVRQQQFTQPAAWSGGEPPHVVGNLHQGDRQPSQRRRGSGHRVQRPLGGEFVRCGDERFAGQRGDAFGDLDAEPRRRGDAGANCRPAGRQFVKAALAGNDVPFRVAQLMCITGPFLPDRQRHRVLQMGAADLDHLHPSRRLLLDRRRQRIQLRQQQIVQHPHRRDMHRRGKCVVAGLAHIHMIVRMHRGLCADRPAQQLDRPVRYHLIQVHVRLGAGSGLPDIQREMLVQRPGDHLIAGLDDGTGNVRWKPPVAIIHLGRRLLDDAVGPRHLLRHDIIADRKVMQAALGLRPPVPVGGHAHRPHRIRLHPLACGFDTDRDVMHGLAPTGSLPQTVVRTIRFK